MRAPLSLITQWTAAPEFVCPVPPPAYRFLLVLLKT